MTDHASDFPIPGLVPPHPLLAVLLDAATGRFPPPDGQIEVVSAAGRLDAAVAFTAHAVIATDRDQADVRSHAGDAFGGATSPAFLSWLAAGRPIGSLDLVLCATARPGPCELDRSTAHQQHPRVVHARELRDDVAVFADREGLVTFASGLAGRCELSLELFDPGRSGAGTGRRLLADALALPPDGTAVFAAVAAGNTRSLRAFLAAGFTPIAAEVIIDNGTGETHKTPA